MRVVAVASAKSSPGASVLAELTAVLWPGEGARVLLDCDPAGSAWVLRPGVAGGRGLVSLAAAARRRLEGAMVPDHLQRIGGIELLAGPAGAHQAHAALSGLGRELAARVRDLPPPVGVVVADCGRLHTATPASELCRAADTVVVVCRPVAAEVVHAAPWVERLRADGCDVAVAVVAAAPGTPGPTYGTAEVGDALEVPVLGPVAHDPPSAAALYRRPGQVRGLGRSALVRSTEGVVHSLLRRWAAQATDGPGAAPLHLAAAGWGTG
jgi:MinD-like ATPase involved in chromosome partitioning or flagellar assembly